MLRRWVDHYGRQLGYDRLLVIDDGSSDGSTKDLPCPVLPLPGGPVRRFGARRTALINGIARGMLEWYEVTIFVDVDEFLVPDPGIYPSLAHYLQRRSEWQVIAPVALNVLHVEDREPPLDPGQPVLGQRSYAKFVPRMCKPSIKRIPADWRDEGHAIESPFRVDPELFMFHLKFADRDHLEAVGDRRYEQHRIDGRGRRSSWTRTGADLTTMLRESVGDADAGRAAEFDPRKVNLAAVVRPAPDGSWRTPRRAQLLALRSQPLRQIPTRFHGLL